MRAGILSGELTLSPGVSLFQGPDAGVLLQSDPMRAIKVNAAAAGILARCRKGWRIDENADDPLLNAALPMLDLFIQAGILQWSPPSEGFTPFVSIVVPVFNRASEIEACIRSLLDLDYPEDLREIIVVDDASVDSTPDMVSKYPVQLLRMAENRGQSAARNRGVEAARGEIIAFTDSDCIADPNWLKDILPFFRDERIALAGGLVDAYYKKSFLDRYEAAQSPLNMGEKPLIGAGDRSVFYVPTCNILFRKSAYGEIGGLNESIRVGEDVDLSWRLLARGHRLLYLPRGRVLHKHRSRFKDAFCRRFDYGTSEPALYLAHQRTIKRFPRQQGGLPFFALCGMGCFALPHIFFPGAGLVLLGEALYKRRQAAKMLDAPLAFYPIFKAVLRSRFTLTHYLALHLTRYYLLPMIALGLIFPKTIPILSGLAFFPALVLYYRKRPDLNFPLFALFFLTEQAFYQAGVMRGCFKTRCFRPYRITFSGAGFLKKSPEKWRKIWPFRKKMGESV